MHYENKGYANDSKGDFEHGKWKEIELSKKYVVNKYSQFK